MEFILFSRPQIPMPAEDISLLLCELNRYGDGFMVNEEFAETIAARTGTRLPARQRYSRPEEIPADRPCVMVCYGGDGTLLEGVRRMGGRRIPILGINYGHLGFLANVPREYMSRALEELGRGSYELQERTMLHITGDFPPGTPPQSAFNELAIHRHGAAMISVETYVDGEMVATYRGDGVILSTPTGSTAYSLSAGGPVLAPGCACLVISPLAPHNLTMRPIVIPERSRVDFRVTGRDPQVDVSADNLNHIVGSGATFSVSKSENSVFFVKLQNISFYDTLRNKMMWGLDPRDATK
ncbi:MAG: NAD(+)/NADH kinase [Rikenellaceae bacterium]|nr:NAD(+)/NADH kinase [Rikenellaceae bacterium]